MRIMKHPVVVMSGYGFGLLILCVILYVLFASVRATAQAHPAAIESASVDPASSQVQVRARVHTRLKPRPRV